MNNINNVSESGMLDIWNILKTGPQNQNIVATPMIGIIV
jgi:hypothetical protein